MLTFKRWPKLTDSKPGTILLRRYRARTQKDLGLWDSLPEAIPVSVCSWDRAQHVLWAFERPFRSFR